MGNIYIGPRPTDYRGLEITKVEPETPMEHQEIEIFFTLTNYGDNPVSGAVRPLLGGKQARITLGPKDSISRSVKAIAPRAGSDTMGILLQFWLEAVPPQEFDVLDTEETIQVNVVASYNIRIDQFEILRTRAVHTDTDYVGLAIKVNDPENLNQPPPPEEMMWRVMGDVNDGVHPVGLAAGPFKVLPSTKVGFSYQIQNYGHDSQGVEDFLNKLSDASEQALELIFPGSVWDAANQFTKYLNDVLFADCDGPVAIDFIAKSGSEINVLTEATGRFTETRQYPGPNVGPNEVKIYESAVGCGRTSDYKVTYSIQRTSFQAG